MSSEDGPEEVMFERSGMKRQGGPGQVVEMMEAHQWKRHAKRYGMSHVWEKV